MRGLLRDADSGSVVFKSPGKPDTRFAGKVSVNFSANSIALRGTLTIDGEPAKINTTLECKEMSPEL